MIKRIMSDDCSSEFETVSININALEKIAEVSSEMQEAIADVKPESDKTYALINALGASEFYGQNRNGDIFPEKALEEYHKTFETGHVFKHHQNKDPNKAIGKVKFACYNKDMHRVELLVEIDNKKAPDVAERINNNQNQPWSMGCKIAYDMCSRCYNKASKPSEYCKHIKNHKNEIQEDGVKIGMINRHPRFFDLSAVTVGADRTAYSLKKIASFSDVKLSAELGEEWLREAQLKESDIDKRLNLEIPAENTVILEQTKRKLKLPEELPGDMPEDWLKSATLKFSADELLSALAYTQIMPTPRDFQYIILSSLDKEAASRYYSENITFVPQAFDGNIKNLEWKIPGEASIHECSKIAADYSLTAPNIFARSMSKISELITHQSPIPVLPIQRTQTPLLEDPQKPTKNPLIPLGILAGLYYTFNKFFKSIGAGTPSPLETVIYKNPILLPILIGGASWGAVKLQDMKNNQYQFSKVAGTPNYWLERALISFPGTYVYAGYQETKRQRGEQLNSAQEFVRKHPLLSSLGVFWGSKKLFQAGKALKEKYAELFITLEPDNFEEIYENIVN